MRVLFICSGNSISGVSAITWDQGESLKKLGVDIFYFPISKPGLRGYLNHSAKLRHFLMKQPYDILHAHYGLCGLVTQLARAKQKTVVSFMGNDIFGSVNQNGRYTKFSWLMCNINRAFARCQYDHVIVKSERQLAVSGLSKNVSVIPNGVDLDHFHPIPKKEAQAHLGWNSPVKRVLFAADPSRPEKNARLAKDALELIRGYPVNLMIAKSVPHDDMKWYYNAADALILTSMHEGSPNVIKEAMACNCPIVSTDVGDVREIIEGVEGCCLTTFNPEDAADKISQAVAFGKKTDGRKRIQAFGLDSDSIARKIIRVYERILGE